MPSIPQFISRPINAASYAWCIDCTWRSQGEWSHKNAYDHGHLTEHITHVYEAEGACNDIYVGGFAYAVSCVAPPGHEGPHRGPKHDQSWTWPNRGVDNAVQTGDNSDGR